MRDKLNKAQFLSRELLDVVGMLLFLFSISTFTASSECRPSDADTTRTRLLVLSYPDSAEVFVDETMRGVTPLTLDDLSVGIHMLSIKKRGYAEFVDTVAVRDQEVDTILVTLSALGRLTVQTDPAGAAVVLDGTVHGISPITIDNLKAGQYRLTLELSGYHQLVRQVGLHPGDTLTLDLKLVSQFGSLSLSLEPQDGVVLVDGDSVGYGGISDYKVLAGKHILEISSPRYPGGIRQEVFVGASTQMWFRARMGASDVIPMARSVLLPGSEQLREGSTAEGFLLAGGAGATAIAISYSVVRFYTLRSDYDKLREDYLKATSEAMALKLHGPLADKYLAVSQQKNLVTTLFVVLAGIVVYNTLDLFLNHQITTNILEPVPTRVGEQKVGTLHFVPTNIQIALSMEL